MGQSRKQQLDKIFEKYPNKSTAQISKDHGIPYSTVYAYRQKLKPIKPKAEPPQAQSCGFIETKIVRSGFTEAQLIWSMVISFAIGAGFTVLMGVI